MDIKENNQKLIYSQNFLKDNKLVERIINQSNIGPRDVVYEIGPGKGIITESLVRKGVKIIAIEKDEELYKRLFQKFKNNKKN